MKTNSKVIVILFSVFLLNGANVEKENDESECPPKINCLISYISPGEIILPRNLDLSVMFENRPVAMDKVMILTDTNGNLIEVEVAKNVNYIKVIWKEKEIYLHRSDLDLSKKLRTLGYKIVKLLKEPNLNSSIITDIPENTLLDVIENTNPLTENKGFVKVKFREKEGWVVRNSLSDDHFDIRFHKLSIHDITKPYLFMAKEDDIKLELRINGNGFTVTECRIDEIKCSVTSKIGESSFGMPQQAIYFDISTNHGQNYLCEIRRQDVLFQLQLLINEYVTEDVLELIMNCSINQESEEESQSDESG
ncbi:SH3 domain-containing protein [Leptospira mtsangambouensis]|uniref:SH3 domain-containing protein n=1 Tax=Leptospira mtsangambouensis TaxID=2484912 RepID=UPI001EEA4511|nr:SH3 domain-containing protein [Leptospira mtsangambouensis]MCG6140350.1 SH3 domain-containing protein [Leptospira mtsangambouensis]